MNLVIYFFLLVLYVSAAISQRGTVGTTTINTGSVTSSTGRSFPFQVSIRTFSSPDVSNNVPCCAGSILSPTWILTAAHCLDKLNSTQGLVIVAGDINNDNNDRRTGRQTITVRYSIPHGLHKKNTLNGYDIALLALSRPLVMTEVVQPISLPQRNTKQIGKATVSGWGVSENFPIGSPILKYTDQIQIIDNEVCKRERKLLKDTQICVIPDSSGIIADACSGDSGGPLTQTDERGIVFVVGIVSYGNDCRAKVPLKPGVYTRVSSFIPWIYNNIVLFELLFRII